MARRRDGRTLLAPRPRCRAARLRPGRPPARPLQVTSSLCTQQEAARHAECGPGCAAWQAASHGPGDLAVRLRRASGAPVA